LSPFLFAAVYYIYILLSKRSGKYYIGLTSDVNRRLEEHNNPSVFNKYTAKHIPWEIKLSFECSEFRGEGLLVERFIKNQKSRIFLEKLIEEKGNAKYFVDLVNNILRK
jgi:putative endonuclease